MDDKVLETICQSLRYILNLNPHDPDLNEEIAYCIGRVGGVISIAGWLEFETNEYCELFIEICVELRD